MAPPIKGEGFRPCPPMPSDASQMCSWRTADDIHQFGVVGDDVTLGQGPIRGSGCNSRSYCCAVAPPRSTLRTELRETYRSRTISLIGRPRTKNSRRIRAIVSTPFIPCPPIPNQDRQSAFQITRGVKFGRRSHCSRGQICTPKHGRHPSSRGLSSGSRSKVAVAGAKQVERHLAAQGTGAVFGCAAQPGRARRWHRRRVVR